ncbi:MAG: hypothetical protein Q8N85_01130, partial [Candidatus Omnitrophota bacterium]|nr:hypothetical protein [Candidatus Omnitrophota bacterium]
MRKVFILVAFFLVPMIVYAESIGEKTVISDDVNGISKHPQDKLEEILEKYSKVKEFTCKFTYFKKDEIGAKIGP